MKQTAVEWLESEMLKPNLSMKEILKQAKEIEKQQIIDAYNEVSNHTGEQYYNETFNK
jgi:hypothetical protein